MRRILKIVSIALALMFVGLQFVRPDMSNPPVNPEETIEATTEVPEEVKILLARSCKDCHSNETTFPWYSNVSPFSWFLAGHIEEGRRELNFSVWGKYDDRQKAQKLEEICEVLEAGEMPLPSYLWVHRDAALNREESERLCNWARAEKAKVTP